MDNNQDISPLRDATPRLRNTICYRWFRPSPNTHRVRRANDKGTAFQEPAHASRVTRMTPQPANTSADATQDVQNAGVHAPEARGELRSATEALKLTSAGTTAAALLGRLPTPATPSS